MSLRVKAGNVPPDAAWTRPPFLSTQSPISSNPASRATPKARLKLIGDFGRLRKEPARNCRVERNGSAMGISQGGWSRVLMA